MLFFKRFNFFIADFIQLLLFFFDSSFHAANPSLILYRLYLFYLIFLGVSGVAISFLARLLARFKFIRNLWMLILFLHSIDRLESNPEIVEELIQFLISLNNSKPSLIVDSTEYLDPIPEKSMSGIFKNLHASSTDNDLFLLSPPSDETIIDVTATQIFESEVPVHFNLIYPQEIEVKIFKFHDDLVKREI